MLGCPPHPALLYRVGQPCLPGWVLGTARLAVPVDGSEPVKRLLWWSSCSLVSGQEHRSRAPSRPDTERSEDTLSPWPSRWQAKVYLSGQRNPYTGNPAQLRPASGAADITGNIKWLCHVRALNGNWIRSTLFSFPFFLLFCVSLSRPERKLKCSVMLSGAFNNKKAFKVLASNSFVFAGP